MASGHEESTDRPRNESANETARPEVGPGSAEATTRRFPETRPFSQTDPSGDGASPPPPGSAWSWDTLGADGNLQPGQVAFGRYLVDQLLGKGGMGSVWLVRHLELDRMRALKLIVAGLATDSQARVRFQREARILARISEHPHAVAIHDARLTSNEIAYIDMEYVRGESLDKILKRDRSMPLAWVDRILGQLCDVLQFAHDNQILHRDLKPSNLMLVDGKPPGQEHLKVLDFGIGKIVGAPEVEEEFRTMTGAFMGTPPYTSPEQGGGQAVPASDFYSVGVILYEFLTGHRPFTGPIMKLIADTMTAEPPPFRVINPELDLPPEVERVVMRCLAKNPEDRPPSARAIAEEFHRAVEARAPAPAHAASAVPVSAAASAPVRGPAADAPRAGGRGSKMPVVFGAVAAAALVLTVGIWSKYGPSKTGEKGGGNGGLAGGQWSGKTNPEPVPSKGTTAPRRVVLAFEPKTAQVTVAGRDRPLDEQGRLELESSELPARIVARAEGRAPLARSISTDEASSAPISVSLSASKPAPKGMEEAGLASAAEAILKRSCRGCHGVDFQGPPFDILDRSALLGPPGSPRIVPGEALKSKVFLAARNPHPKERPAPGLPPADRELLLSWIEAGAKFLEPPPRPLRTDADDLAAIVADLKAAKDVDRPFLRYVSLSSLANRGLPDRTMRQARAAVSKALNSLSWGGEIFVPRVADADGMILAVDVRNLGWDKSRLWDRMLLPQYPYGIGHKTDAREPVRALAREAAELSPSPLPTVRADWLVATATRPPLYHGLLGLPKSVGELETRLQVNARADFANADLIRVASGTNPHALHPRIIDNHAPFTRAFWRTYDLRAREDGPGGIFAAPLGPAFDGHPAPELAFRPDAEAILFSLPNKLHGYWLGDSKGARVDAAPDDLLRDPLKTAGTASVVTGLSCLACHRVGIKRFRDELGAKVSVNGNAMSKLGGLRPKDDREFEELFDGHEKRFLEALDKATGPFLKQGEDSGAEIGSFPEPIGPIARLYYAHLDPQVASAELGLTDPASLASQLAALDTDGKLGLAPLAKDGTVPREKWVEAFPAIVKALKLGALEKVYGIPAE